MAKAIINKHIDSVESISKNLFIENEEHRKGELIICNDPNNPSIYIMDTEGAVRKVSGGSNGSGGDYDDTELRSLINQNKEAIEAIKNTGSSNATISNDIKVSNLNGVFGAGNYEEDDIITAGTSFEEILRNILSKEGYPTVSTTTAKASASMSSLTLELSHSGSSVNPIEVGTLVYLVSGNTNGSSVNTTASTITNMKYGYKVNVDDESIINVQNLTSPCVTGVSSNTYVLKTTITGFDADSRDDGYKQASISTVSGIGSANLVETALGCVKEGSNTIKLDATGVTYSYYAEKLGPVYYCSNFNNNSSDKFKEVPYVSGTTQAKISKSITVESRYKYFFGYSDIKNADDLTSNDIRELNVYTNWIKNGANEDTIILGNSTTKSEEGKSIVIACPNTYKVKTIEYGVGSSMLGDFQEISKAINTGEIQTTYRIYFLKGLAGTSFEFKNISLTHA